MAAAWAALTSGRPRELRVLESLLEQPVEGGPSGGVNGLEFQVSMRRLELLLAATERNLRILRGPDRMG